jgi:hypothetical protein
MNIYNKEIEQAIKSAVHVTDDCYYTTLTIDGVVEWKSVLVVPFHLTKYQRPKYAKREHYDGALHGVAFINGNTVSFERLDDGLQQFTPVSEARPAWDEDEAVVLQ